MGTSAVLTITSNSFPIEGGYEVLWSTTPKFEAGKTITLKEGNAPRGSLAITETFSVPEAPMGLYYVGFIRPGREESNQTFSFSIVPRIKTQPVQAIPGATVTVYGTGFPPDDIDILSFDGKAQNINITSSKTGSFTVDYIIPGVTAGEHQFSVSSTKTSSGIPAGIIVVTPSIAIDTQLPQSGATITMTGRGFAARTTISIKCNDVSVTNSPSSDDAGNFTYSFIVPSSSQGGYRFVATDQSGNNATITSGSAPPPPVPLPTPPATPQPTKAPTPTVTKTLPKPGVLEPKGQSFGMIGSEAVKFVWSEGSGINTGQVTYTLEVADNFKFSGVKSSNRASGINQTSHALNLEPGTYFWRIKAVDTAGNESEWANSLYAFNVGMMPDWLIVLGVIGAIIICYLILRPSPRRRQQQQSPYHYY